MDSILDSLDNGARKAVFEHNLAKLEATVPVDIDALRLCTRLLPRLKFDPAASTCHPLEERFWTSTLSHIFAEEDAERLYTIADIYLKNERLVAAGLSTRLYNVLEHLSTFLSRYRSVEPSDEEELRFLDQKSNQAIGYLRFLKCSYWLSGKHNQLIGSKSVALISSFLGLDRVDDVANDTLSAFLSLLDSRGPIVIAPPQRLSEADPWWKSDQRKCLLPIKEVIDESFWSHFHENAAHAFANNSSKHFRTWLQWISQAASTGIALDCIYRDSYWNKLQAGLQNGFSDQRKYCLAIIRQTLLAAQRDIDCHTMQFTHSERSAYIRAYDQFAVLFETVVLDRYPNQVQACLPELTTLLGSNSKISPAITVTLLTAALNSKIQEGIRKIVGNWYMNLVLEVSILWSQTLHLVNLVPSGNSPGLCFIVANFDLIIVSSRCS
jgi:tRNA guanosine-2'-O-methyltransferase